jgi:DNA-binding PadR family transcriptional regulator
MDDRIEIENPGTLQSGMTLESMKQGSSRIRNHVIARVFRELNIIERWGSGISSIFNEADALGLPEPQIMEIGARIRVTIYLATTTSVFGREAQDEKVLAQVIKIDKAQEDRECKVEEKGQDSTLIAAQQSGRVKGQVDAHILAVCLLAPLSSAEIATALGHKQLSGNLRKALPRLREAGLVEYTIPESPNSRLQKYRLTEKGKAARFESTIPEYIAKAQVIEQAELPIGAQVELLFEAHDSGRLKAQVYSQILELCSIVPRSSAEIATALGHKQLSGNLRKVLPQLRNAGLLQYTILEKPNSRLQRYRLTPKGRALLNAEQKPETEKTIR